jgi:ATP-dependent exoDNAse (exonuclease V) beta subunit
VKPGLHDLGSGCSVVWWDPHTLKLESPPYRGLRRDDLIDKTIDSKIVETDLHVHLAGKAGRDAAIARASQPSIDVATATARAIDANAAGKDLASPDSAAQSRNDPPDSTANIMVEHLQSTAKLDLPRGVRFGALVHAVLATVPLDSDESSVRAAAELQSRILGASEAEVDAATTVVSAMFAHPLIDRARRASQCRRETPVAFVDDDGVVIDGQVDLAFEDADGWTVVDFKTSREVRADLALQRRQVALYARGIAMATRKPVRGVVLVA